MRTYEKDTEIKIPNWYLKLPQKTINRISDIGLSINRILPQIRKKSTKKITTKRKRVILNGVLRKPSGMTENTV